MKKILTACSTVFILLGLQAQKTSAKKEIKPTTTAKPKIEKSSAEAKTLSKNYEIKRTATDTHIKKSGR